MAGTSGSGVYSESTYGSVTHVDKLSTMVRYAAQPLMQMATLTKAEAALGAHKGDTVYLPKVQDLPESTSPIAEFSSLPVKRAPINTVAVTINEYGNSYEYTGRAKLYAEYNLDEVAQTQIARNIAQSKDSVVGAVYKACDAWAIPQSGGTTFTEGASAPGAAADKHIDAEVFRTVRKKFRQNPAVPTYDDRFYLAVMSASAYHRLFTDTQTGGIQDTFKYAAPENLIRGEMFEFYGFRIIEENHVLSDTLGTTSYEGEILFIGADAVAEAMAQPERIMTRTWDWDRFLGIAWTFYAGWKLIWNYTDDSEYRVMRVSST